MARGKPQTVRPRIFQRNFWKMVGTSIYYGILVQVGTMQAKTLLCRLSRTYELDFTVNEFWMLFGLFLVLFTLLDYFLLQSAARILKAGKYSSTESKAVYNVTKTSKHTRSGAVYGYM